MSEQREDFQTENSQKSIREHIGYALGNLLRDRIGPTEGRDAWVKAYDEIGKSFTGDRKRLYDTLKIPMRAIATARGVEAMAGDILLAAVLYRHNSEVTNILVDKRVDSGALGKRQSRFVKFFIHTAIDRPTQLATLLAAPVHTIEFAEARATQAIGTRVAMIIDTISRKPLFF